MKRRLALAAVALAIGAALVAWFLDRYEYVEASVYAGYQGEARSNPLLALQRLLRELGFAVSVGYTPAALPAHGVFVVGADRWTLPAGAQSQLLDWVRRGNTLIMEAKPAGINDPLSDALGIERELIKPAGASTPHPRGVPDGGPQSNAPPEEGQAPGEEGPRDATSAPTPVRDAQGEPYTLPWAPRTPYRVVLGPRQVLSAHAQDVEYRLGDARGSFVLGLALGRGRVIAFNSFLPLYNWAISRADNGVFLVRIAAREGSGPVLFFRNPVKASLWGWLLSHAAASLAGAAVLAVLLLWRAAVRAGPVFPDPPPARRRWADHLEAAGRFLWQSGARARLARRAREAAFVSVDRRIPGFAALPAEAQKAALVRQLGLRPDESAQLLGPLPAGPAAVIAEARLLRRLHALILPPSRVSPP